jgi:hypothetical protein
MTTINYVYNGVARNYIYFKNCDFLLDKASNKMISPNDRADDVVEKVAYLRNSDGSDWTSVIVKHRVDGEYAGYEVR